jgi:hypothetical protein
MRANPDTPSLKSASGAGFSFEDNVTARLFVEMLVGQSSLAEPSVISRLERQASDWEPFGDLLLTLTSAEFGETTCGVSIKSNRPINTQGCDAAICAGLWDVLHRREPDDTNCSLALFCSRLPPGVSDHVHALCQRARTIEPTRLDEKVVHGGIRKIYDSFRFAQGSGDTSLPGHVLRVLVLREFDFEEVGSRDRAEALRLCGECLPPGAESNDAPGALWAELLLLAQELRVSGGALTRAGLATRLRQKFTLRDDPIDRDTWAQVRRFSKNGLDEIRTSLGGGLALPRSAELASLEESLADTGGVHVLGDSGSGKSALAKLFAHAASSAGAEVVWAKAERFGQLLAMAPNFVVAAKRMRAKSGLFIIDALEGCYSIDALQAIARTVAELRRADGAAWSVILICQTPEWSRVLTQGLLRDLHGDSIVAKRVQCGWLSDEDLARVCVASSAVARLVKEPRIRRLLRSPKLLDVVLNGQLSEERPLAGEADLVQWWWDDQICGSHRIAPEERVARHLAAQMADELRTELPPDVVCGSEATADGLLRKGVLSRSADGSLRFQHDLFADWSRVMHLRSLGADAVSFMLSHSENPPWLRAIRLLSQHLLERIGDTERWREVLAECNPPTRNVEAAENLQVLDEWLLGVAFCSNPDEILSRVRADLFANRGYLLRRLIRRLLHAGTLPDPVIQDHCKHMDAATAQTAATVYRLPRAAVWSAVIRFLASHPDEATDFVPVELAELAGMWARFEQYLGSSWPVLAELALTNAERELRREVAGKYRHDSGPRRLSDGHRSRVTIYSGGLFAASQLPQRAARLLLKAAGRAEWEPGDVSPTADRAWIGEWEERSSSITRFLRVDKVLGSWPLGPQRRTSDDFFHAWFESGAAITLYRREPKAACEGTLGLLLAWPRFEMRKDHRSHNAERYGFTYDADHMYPPFYTKGPFLQFLREDSTSAIDLVLDLVNFATDRYADWWPYDPIQQITLPTAESDAVIRGNHQVYFWYRFEMNTPDVVTCALMALEKYLEEQIATNHSIGAIVQRLLARSTSFAFAGLLVGLGKRHPSLFLGELRPLLFAREIFMLDLQAIRDESVVSDGWMHDGEVVNKLRREWNALPGRRISLLDQCCEWLLTNADLAAVLEEVCHEWRRLAEQLPDGSEERLILLRWASNFDRSLWNEVTLPNGQRAWRQERPPELRDVEAEQQFGQRQMLFGLPMQCEEAIEKRHPLSAEQARLIWERIDSWGDAVGTKEPQRADDFESVLTDDRHSLAGLCALLLCNAETWLADNPNIWHSIAARVQNLLESPPTVTAFSPDDFHTDGEAFLARCAVRLWAQAPKAMQWRAMTARFVTAYRYRTVQALFQEAFHVRDNLGSALSELRALALSYAKTRQQASRNSWNQTPEPNAVEDWARTWLPRFAERAGPEWSNTWPTDGTNDNFPIDDQDAALWGGRGSDGLGRRDYEYDMGVVLAIFSHLPALTEARDASERAEWLSFDRQLLQAFLQTIPAASDSDTSDRRYDVWSCDEKIFDVVAARVFQCTAAERAQLWQPIIDLGPGAHRHITRFLDDILLEALRTEPPRVGELLPIWRGITEYLFASSTWTRRDSRGAEEVWKHIFLYGTPFSSIGDDCFGPFIDGMHSFYERHLPTLDGDAYEQASLAGFLVTKSGERLLIPALIVLGPTWERADHWFWDKAAEESRFGTLLVRAWQTHFATIRNHPTALRAFKTLTLNLAAHHVPVALEVQAAMAS